MDAALPNFGIQEMSWAIHYNKGADLGTYLKNPEVLEVKDGFIKVPMTPGLGIEINEEMVRANAKDAKHWSNLVWRGEDGGLREVSALVPRYACSQRLIDPLF
jgi:galactonate dehydratase